MKEEGGELRLPNSIYTVAICAGFFCDGNVWDAIEAHSRKIANLAAKAATLGMVDDMLDVEKSGVSSQSYTFIPRRLIGPSTQVVSHGC